MKDTAAFHITALYRDFLAYTTEALKGLGLSFGQMPIILYTGKHPGCTQAELTRALKLDWGYSQRSVTKLADTGFIHREYDRERACNCLTLTAQGISAFDTSHDVFLSWDRSKTAGLSAQEQETLLRLLHKLTAERNANS